ncbi:MAG: VCBS repeat-containing protein [Acidobacteriota bacterium]
MRAHSTPIAYLGPVLAALLLAGAAIVGAQPTADPATTAALPDRDALRAEFDVMCARQTGSDNVYFGNLPLRRLDAELQRPGLPATRRSEVQGARGRILTVLGKLPEALAAFEDARTHGADLPEDERLQLVRDQALTHLLRAEDENCVAAHGAGACVLPLTDAALHQRDDHTRRAAALYDTYLGARPYNLQVRWLFNLTQRLARNWPDGVPEAMRAAADVLVPSADADAGRWPDRASALGVAAFDLAGGAVMDDFDGDGLLDLISSTWDPCDHLKAFRNDGRGGFEDVTARWGLDVQYGGLNLIHGDVDGDGRLDLLILRGAWQGRHGELRNSLLRNVIDGDTGGFVDVTRAAGLSGDYPTQTAAFADYDLDGDLDLYIGHEAEIERPYPSQLWRNDGVDPATGAPRLTDVTRQAGVANLRYAKGVAWGDIDSDGDPDLYVSNIGPNRLYRNNGDGTFVDVAAAAGVHAPVRRSFATWFFDVDGDGHLDLFVADYDTPFKRVSASYLGVPARVGQPHLYRNRGDGTFEEISRDRGLDRPLLPMGANHGDIDSDGDPDIYLGTGLPELEGVMPNVLYRNEQGHFVDATAAVGVGHLQKGHAVAFGDLDNDGDLDLFAQMGGAYPVDAYFNALYDNPLRRAADAPDAGPAWLTLRLEGVRANRFGVGARIAARVVDPGGATRTVHTTVDAGGSFGASSLQAELGRGAARARGALTVRWPGGAVETLVPSAAHPIPLRRFYRLREGAGHLVPLDPPRLDLSRISEHAPNRHHHDHRAGPAAGHAPNDAAPAAAADAPDPDAGDRPGAAGRDRAR